MYYLNENGNFREIEIRKTKPNDGDDDRESENQRGLEYCYEIAELFVVKGAKGFKVQRVQRVQGAKGFKVQGVNRSNNTINDNN